MNIYVLIVFGSSTPPEFHCATNDTTIGNNPKSSAATKITIAGHPQYSHHALIAGWIGGYTVWGRYTSINYQIVLYLASRVIVAIFQRLSTTTRQQQKTQHLNHFNARNPISVVSIRQLIKDRIYSLSAATIWGIVMFLFEDSPDFLHPSLKSSMDEIYRFSNRT